MKDISEIFNEAISKSFQYNSKNVSNELENIPNIWCRLEDDSQMNWYLISETDGKSVKSYLGYLSKKYPVALLYIKCPQKVKELLKDNKILVDEYNDRYSCDENILKKYVDNVVMIDDRFLYDDKIPFDVDKFLIIDEGIQYINPYNFSIESIK
ncbi:MAG: hypothetical protein Q4F95_04045 [Oscillospiraceae bacterium]|nr:hypothetical protein [Oscillospiraceae bacterium]